MTMDCEELDSANVSLCLNPRFSFYQLGRCSDDSGHCGSASEDGGGDLYTNYHTILPYRVTTYSELYLHAIIDHS